MNTTIVLSLPNSGTTWFCNCINKHTEGEYYDEYFNPILNSEHEVALRRTFGSELACCYKNIATDNEDTFDDTLNETWFSQTRYTLTKENYSPFKLHLFKRAFTKVVVLLRHTAGVFPPSRARVWSFYEHAWQALADAGHPLKEIGLRSRAMEAHTLMARHMRQHAKELDIPIVYNEDLHTDRMESMVLDAGFSQAVVDEIAKTRRPKHIDWDAVY